MVSPLATTIVRTIAVLAIVSFIIFIFVPNEDVVNYIALLFSGGLITVATNSDLQR